MTGSARYAEVNRDDLKPGALMLRVQRLAELLPPCIEVDAGPCVELVVADFSEVRDRAHHVRSAVA